MSWNLHQHLGLYTAKLNDIIVNVIIVIARRILWFIVNLPFCGLFLHFYGFFYHWLVVRHVDFTEIDTF